MSTDAATAGLRVVTLSTSMETPGSTYGPFLLPQYALTWIVEGRGTTWLDDHPIQTRPGTLILMRAGMTLRHDWAARSFQAFAVFAFDTPPPGRETWPLERHLDPGELLFSLFRFVLACAHEGPEGAPSVALGVELMLSMYLSGLTGGMATVTPGLSEPVSRALEFMASALHGQPDAPLSLAAIAAHAGVAPTHLCRLFRRDLDASPVACASLLRVELCAGLLERTAASIAEVAEKHGYSSPFHFSRAFKQAYGVAPSEYRRAFRRGFATRPGGLVFRYHRLRRFLYEQGPGKILLPNGLVPGAPERSGRRR